MTKEEKKKRKAAKYPTGAKWLSNVSEEDAKKIRKTFSQVIEGPPRRTDCESVEELSKTGLIGLYNPKEKS